MLAVERVHALSHPKLHLLEVYPFDVIYFLNTAVLFYALSK
jgi:hypothetical protein